MSNKDAGIVFLKDWNPLVKGLSPENQLVFWGLFSEYEYGKDQECENIYVKPIWTYIKNQIDKHRQKYDEKIANRNRINGLRGGRPPKEDKPIGIEENPENPVGFSETQKTLNKHKTNNKHRNKNITPSEYSRSTKVLVSRGLTDEQKKLRHEYKEILDGIQRDNPPIAEVYRRIAEFQSEKRPHFPAPYIEMWRIFAAKHGLTMAEEETPFRVDKIKARSKEPKFDFAKILKALGKDPFSLGKAGSDYRIEFDHLIKNQSKYIQLLEKHPE